ncbi:hypothetical protein C900_00973 [Fulvivirga imtechensis AK7]|uniref:Uncharacterized protein n=1 Tax=Fulvivirga imtechensis AK7 TaxID=1237149 RepID=L8JY71_9BACT|nr:hypothetical protein C900_00973 [Fulvivirga imtechensis AK7]
MYETGNFGGELRHPSVLRTSPQVGETLMTEVYAQPSFREVGGR